MLTIARGAGQSIELGDPRSPALRIRVDAVHIDSAVITLNLLRPGRIMAREEFAAGSSTPELAGFRGSTHTISRRTGQAVLYGDPRNPMAVVEIAEIMNDRVRVSVSCDHALDVHRFEVAEQIRGDQFPS